MRRTKINLWLDIICFVVLLLVIISGFVLWFALPSGGGRGQGASEARSGWKTIHDYTGLVFTILILLHLVLHWNWIRRMPHILSKPASRADQTDMER